MDFTNGDGSPRDESVLMADKIDMTRKWNWPIWAGFLVAVGGLGSAIAFLLFAFFAYEIFYVLRQVPASNGAPRVGQLAPDFLLLDQNGNPVGLGDLLRGQSGPKAVALIFYRGFW